MTLPSLAALTENVTVPAGGSVVGGHGPLYRVFVIVALAEMLSATLGVVVGPVLPAGVVGPLVGDGGG